MAEFECSVEGPDGQVQVLHVKAPNAELAKALAEPTGRVLSVKPHVARARPTKMLSTDEPARPSPPPPAKPGSLSVTTGKLAIPSAPVPTPKAGSLPALPKPGSPGPGSMSVATGHLSMPPGAESATGALSMPSGSMSVPTSALSMPRPSGVFSVPTKKRGDWSTGALTPNSEAYVAVGLVKEGRFSNASLVIERATRQKLVAFQLAAPGALPEPEAKRRFTIGAEALQRLSSPGIPRCMGYQHTLTGHWMLFEYIEGPPLSLFDGAGHGIADEWVAWWLYQMLGILEGLHGLGRVLGGLHPRHFVMSGQGLELVHLGLMENLFPEAVALTRTQERLAFTAPEHRHSVLISKAGDLYSVGAIAWWLAMGSPPPQAPPLASEVAQTLLLQARPGLAPEAASVIARLLSFQAADRYSTATEACDELTPGVPTVAPAQVPVPPIPTSIQLFDETTVKRLGQEAAALEGRTHPPAAPPTASRLPTPRITSAPSDSPRPDARKAVPPAPQPEPEEAELPDTPVTVGFVARAMLGAVGYHLFRSTGKGAWTARAVLLLAVIGILLHALLPASRELDAASVSGGAVYSPVRILSGDVMEGHTRALVVRLGFEYQVGKEEVDLRSPGDTEVMLAPDTRFTVVDVNPRLVTVLLDGGRLQIHAEGEAVDVKMQQ
ncbi:MAG TPA: hypothetical protein VGO93_26550, partial [Candidatus Xenobia bacterium]